MKIKTKLTPKSVDMPLKDALINKGKVALNSGSSFGIGGDGYYRINLACPRAMVLEALKRIEFAINSL